MALKGTLVIIFVPNQPTLEKWAKIQGVEGDFFQVHKDPT